ncbi:MAG: hypothetical protein FWF53_06815 [Candidatus Azobacteroides sp.]|nr:hypothetical protein [Candidatus Azobacteroides sp.]
MLNQNELKARIEEEKKLLEFYVRYEKDIVKMTSETEWEIEVNECLDNLIQLYLLLKE